MNHELPSRPWQKVGADLLHVNNKDYLVTVDYYSNFWEIDRLYDNLSKTVIQKMTAHFSRYGIPEQLVTDNGPQFVSSSFRHFTIKYDIQHTTSSPHQPRSNRKAESAVKVAKRILKKTLKTGEDPYLAILNLRNTPQQGIDLSPAQRLMGRRTKTLLPTNANLLRPEHATPEIAEKLNFQQTKQQFYYNKTAKPLRPLQKVAQTGAAPSYEQVETPKTPQRLPRSPVPRVPAKSPVPKVPAKPPESPVKSQTPYVSHSRRSSKRPAHLDEYVT